MKAFEVRWGEPGRADLRVVIFCPIDTLLSRMVKMVKLVKAATPNSAQVRLV